MGFNPFQKKEFEAMYGKLVSLSNADQKIVQLTDTMLQLMVDCGEAQVKHISCKRVVPHEQNRNSSLMSDRKVFQKGSKILAVGFSLVKCGPMRAVCFGVNPTTTRGVEAFVQHANGNPHLGNFSAQSVEGRSVGCGHLNQFIAAIFDEVQVPDEFKHDLKDFVGHADKLSMLDKHAICKADGKDLAGVLENGLKWTYIPYSFEVEFPKLPALLTSALNVEHHIGEGETWDEQFIGLAKAIVDHYSSPATCNKQPDYSRIMRETLRSKPPRSIDVEAHMNFCKKWGGGKTQSFSIDICKFIKMKSYSRIVGGSTFEAITRLQLKGESMVPNFIAAVVKCTATRGQERHGVSIHITDGDLKLVTKNMEAVLEAENYMLKAKELEATICTNFVVTTGSQVAELRGDMECDMVEFALKKMAKIDRAWNDLNQIVDKFVQTVSGHTPTVTSEPSSSHKSEQSMFDPSASVGRQTIVNLGWSVGNIIRDRVMDPKKPTADRQFEISYINDDGSVGIYHIGPDGSIMPDMFDIVPQVELASKYKIATQQCRLSKIDGLPSSIKLGDGIWNAAAVIGINEAYCSQSQCPKLGIYLQQKPVQKVIAHKDRICVGNAVFVPWSTSVKLVQEPNDNPLHVVVLDSDHNELATFSIDLPSFKIPEYDVIAFWKLRRTGELEHSNMKIVSVEVKVPLPKLDESIDKFVFAKVPIVVMAKDVDGQGELVLHIPLAKKKSIKTTSLVAICEPHRKKHKV